MLILQLERQSGDARCSITFADEIFRRTPAVVAGNERVEPFGEVFDIGVDAKKPLGFGGFIRLVFSITTYDS